MNLVKNSKSYLDHYCGQQKDYRKRIYQKGVEKGEDLIRSKKISYLAIKQIKETHDFYEVKNQHLILKCHWHTRIESEEVYDVITSLVPESYEDEFLKGLFDGILLAWGEIAMYL